MNVYDFDKTIYNGDSTCDFYFFCLCKNPAIIRYLPYQGWSFALWKIGNIDKTQFKERFYVFLKGISDIDSKIELFWSKNIKNIKDFYKAAKRHDDIIISASPHFLLEPICKKLGNITLIASKVDKRSGKYDGVNCWGEEKVKRFKELFENAAVDKFFSDSRSDTPLAKLSKEAFLVKGNKIFNW